MNQFDNAVWPISTQDWFLKTDSEVLRYLMNWFLRKIGSPLRSVETAKAYQPTAFFYQEIGDLLKVKL